MMPLTEQQQLAYLLSMTAKDAAGGTTEEVDVAEIPKKLVSKKQRQIPISKYAFLTKMDIFGPKCRKNKFFCIFLKTAH